MPITFINIRILLASAAFLIGISDVIAMEEEFRVTPKIIKVGSTAEKKEEPLSEKKTLIVSKKDASEETDPKYVKLSNEVIQLNQKIDDLTALIQKMLLNGFCTTTSSSRLLPSRSPSLESVHSWTPLSGDASAPPTSPRVGRSSENVNRTPPRSESMPSLTLHTVEENKNTLPHVTPELTNHSYDTEDLKPIKGSLNINHTGGRSTPPIRYNPLSHGQSNFLDQIQVDVIRMDALLNNFEDTIKNLSIRPTIKIKWVNGSIVYGDMITYTSYKTISYHGLQPSVSSKKKHHRGNKRFFHHVGKLKF